MKKILVIDDDVAVRTMLTQMLKRAGYEVESAMNGKEATPMIRAQWPDLVVTDMIMPDQEGIETMKIIREAAPNTKIIAVSGGGRTSNFDFLEIAKRLGADGVFAKPIDRQQFLSAMQEMLRS